MAIECGGIPPQQVTLVGAGGTGAPMFVTGTDPAIGGTVNQVIDMATYGSDYVFPTGATFLILIESAAVIEVQLADGNNFTISAVHATTYLGDWIPMPLLKVYESGTTGTFSVGI